MSEQEQMAIQHAYGGLAAIADVLGPTHPNLKGICQQCLIELAEAFPSMKFTFESIDAACPGWGKQ